MPALCLILTSAYYANNYAGIFDAGLHSSNSLPSWDNTELNISK